MKDAKIDSAVREKVGSRAARRLRAMGRMVASVQADADHPHIDLHFDEASFHAARRHHAHLFDLDFGASTETVIVRELQWDAFGDTLFHVEFKRVVRGQKTQSQVRLRFVGNPAGILNHDLSDVTVSCIPSLIPDTIDVVVDGLQPGTHLKAKDIDLPDGIELVIDPEAEIAMITDLKAAAADTEAEGDEAEGEDGGAAPADGGGD